MLHFYNNTYTVAFFGHRVISDIVYVENELEKIISKIYKEQEYVVFLVGKDGDFDRIVSTSEKRTQRRFGKSKSSHVWVLPYLTSDLKANEKYYCDYYDEIELATDVTGIYHYKSAFLRRNRMMVDRADLVVVYVDHKSNGAYKAYEYVLKIGKDIVNLSHCPQNFREN